MNRFDMFKFAAESEENVKSRELNQVFEIVNCLYESFDKLVGDQKLLIESESVLLSLNEINNRTLQELKKEQVVLSSRLEVATTSN